MTDLNYGNVPSSRRATFSIPSILAIVCALGSFFTGAGLALLLCILAIVFGIIGAVLALLPGTRGGMMSILSIALAAIGVIVALVRILTPGHSTPPGGTAGGSSAVLGTTPPAIVRTA
jgi:hypothetical protein